MTNWTQLHTDVHISGGDGFSFVLIPRPRREFKFNANGTHVQSDDEKDFIKLCLPGRKPKVINGITVEIEPYDALRMYLCESMSSTFAMSTMQRDGKFWFMVGVRSQRDLFKLNLKFEETQNTKVWDANTLFYVRVAEGDDFADDGSASFGHRRERSEEGW
jgi:hypothetical protein